MPALNALPVPVTMTTRTASSSLIATKASIRSLAIEPDRFTIKPIHQMSGLNTYGVATPPIETIW